MFTIVTIAESDFQPYTVVGSDKTYKKVVLNKGKFAREIVIAPHYCETYISIQLLKLKLYCKEHNIKLVSIGSINQLPFFGMFSDEVICQEANLKELFTAESGFGTDAKHFPDIPNFHEIYNDDFVEKQESKKVKADDVIRGFANPTVYLRESTLELYNSLSLPANVIACEVKTHFYPKLYHLLEETHAPRTVLGWDKVWQKEMVASYGDHFMGIQILASIYKGWRYIAAGGAVNLFNVLPIHPLLFEETEKDFTLEYQKIARDLCMLRYGTIPFFVTYPYRIYAGRGVAEDNLITQNMLLSIYSAAAVDVPPPSVTVQKLGVVPSKVVDGSFLYVREGFPDTDIKLSQGNKIVNGPGFNESKWALRGDEIRFLSDDNVDRVVMRRQSNGEFTGTFVNSGFPTKTRLVPKKSFVIPYSLALRIGKKKIKWIFAFEHDFRFFEKHILPWALPDAERIDTSVTDFSVGVYLQQRHMDYLQDMQGIRFLLACEKETRYLPVDKCFSFVQNPLPQDDPKYVRYAPTMCCWVPPLSPSKDKVISSVDSGLYQWRKDKLLKLSEKVPMDIFGGMSGKTLPGHHGFSGPHGNEKFVGLQDYAFYAAIERGEAPDYITEKITDAIMAECVPVYLGAPNVYNYFYPESYIAWEDIDKVDWKNWEGEYQKRYPAITAQKRYLQSHLNVFNYFDRLTDDLSLLANPRPITLQTSTYTANRKVVSYSLFGNNNFYRMGLPAIVRAHHNVFPGWELRIYHDNLLKDSFYGKELIALQEAGLVNLIPMGVTAPWSISALWRLKPCWDDDVEWVICRDLDSLPSRRDAHAVKQFMASGATAHVITDHPDHNIPMMTGMMGYRVPQLQTLLKDRAKDFDDFIKVSGYDTTKWHIKGTDQVWLGKFMWPLVERLVCEHRIRGYGPSNSALVTYRSIDTVDDKFVPFIGAAGFDVKQVVEFYKAHGNPEIEARIAAVDNQSR